MNNINIMIDIETLGRRSDAAILQIGVVAFNFSTGEIIECKMLKIKESEWAKNNRTFTGETVIWWLFQDQHAKNNLCNGKLTQREALISLSEFVNKYQGENCRIWAKGTMDINVLQCLYNDLGIDVPWQWWQPRDMRTLSDIVPILKKKYGIEHSALDDAICQVKQVCQGISAINEMLLTTKMKDGNEVKCNGRAADWLKTNLRVYDADTDCPCREKGEERQ